MLKIFFTFSVHSPWVTAIYTRVYIRQQLTEDLKATQRKAKLYIYFAFKLHLRDSESQKGTSIPLINIEYSGTCSRFLMTLGAWWIAASLWHRNFPA
jgi:hypothetical protein